MPNLPLIASSFCENSNPPHICDFSYCHPLKLLTRNKNGKAKLLQNKMANFDIVSFD